MAFNVSLHNFSSLCCDLLGTTRTPAKHSDHVGPGADSACGTQRTRGQRVMPLVQSTVPQPQGFTLISFSSRTLDAWGQVQIHFCFRRLAETLSRDAWTCCAVFVQLNDVKNTDLCLCSIVVLVHEKVINSNQASEAAEKWRLSSPVYKSISNVRLKK